MSAQIRLASMEDGFRPTGYQHRVGEEIDGFRLREPLGRGGNGEVWKAAHKDHGAVALKLLAAKRSEWVLLTRQAYPQPGEHRADELVSQVGSYTPHPWASQLDEILAAATRLDPAARIQAAELSASLRAIQADAQPLEAAVADEEALRRLSERLRPSQSDAARRESYLAKLRARIVPRCAKALEHMNARVKEIAPHQSSTGAALHQNVLLGWRTMTDEIGSPEVLEVHRLGYWAYTEDPKYDWSLTGGMGFELLADGTLRVVGAQVVLRAGATGYQRVMEVRDEVPVMSPRAEEVCVEVAANVAAQTEAALAAWSVALDDDG